MTTAKSEEQEHSCLLSEAHLCDGQHSVQPGPRARPTRCQCARIAALLAAGDVDGARVLNIERARVVANLEAVKRVVSARLTREQW